MFAKQWTIIALVLFVAEGSWCSVSFGRMQLSSEIRKSQEAEDTEIAEVIFGAIPKELSVRIVPDEGKLVFEFSTNKMETIGSSFGGASPFKEVESVRFFVTVTPRFPHDLLKKLNQRNLIAEKERSGKGDIGRFSDLIIELPSFVNQQHGFKFDYPSRVPSKHKDYKRLLKSILEITSTWKYVGFAKWGKPNATTKFMLSRIIGGSILPRSDGTAQKKEGKDKPKKSVGRVELIIE